MERSGAAFVCAFPGQISAARSTEFSVRAQPQVRVSASNALPSGEPIKSIRKLKAQFFGQSEFTVSTSNAFLSQSLWRQSVVRQLLSQRPQNVVCETKAEDEADSPWTPAAELLNGRAAMIGIIGLVVLEITTGYGLLHLTYEKILAPSLELIGFGFLVWFGVNNILLKDQRAKLVQSVEDIITKIKGSS
uniref:Stress-enhanced protein 1 n=1 Tax=Glaucocystis nostochinearum TaxID=38271 RepID=D9PTQ4_9EUKA|nr:TPA_inf: stress-enhanced protein 1 [Glaucocystis nostochinearum]